MTLSRAAQQHRSMHLFVCVFFSSENQIFRACTPSLLPLYPHKVVLETTASIETKKENEGVETFPTAMWLDRVDMNQTD